MRNREVIMYLYQPFKLAPLLKNWCHHRLQNHQATRFFMLSCCLLLIASCTTIGNKNDRSNLNGINPLKLPPSSWQINAKLGIRSPQKNGSVTLNWQQTAGNFTIKVQGPLGQGNAVISGTQYNAEIKQPGKPTVQSNNVDALVFDTFGWTLPFDNFMHWVVATANPQKIIGDISYDPTFGTLSTLEQSGWALDYSRYKPVDTWALPGRISATHIDKSNKDEAQTKLTLIIRKWTIL